MIHLLRGKSLVLAIFFNTVVHAEPWTNVTCTNPETTWTVNSLGQSPCLVAASLQAVCSPDNTWGVPAHGVNDTGYGPGESNKCSCTSVVWSLLAACSLCQKFRSTSWATYSSYCLSSDTSLTGVYPAPIPVGVKVPHWAYYDYVTAGSFNLAIARQQTGPESTAPPGLSGTAAPTSTATISTVSSATITSTSAPANSSSGKSDTGAIVGGVVGGVLGIALFALIAFYIVHKNKQKKPEDEPPTTQFDGANATYGQYPSGIQTSSFVPTTPSYKPYDPSDPSTFPANRQSDPNSDSAPALYYQQHADTNLPNRNVPQL